MKVELIEYVGGLDVDHEREMSRMTEGFGRVTGRGKSPLTSITKPVA